MMGQITEKWTTDIWEHFRYKWHLGMVAWAIHRVTGVGITVYLGLHIWSISKIYGGPEAFKTAMDVFRQPMFKVMEIMLFGAVVYHTMNGLRLIWVDFFGGARYHKQLFWGFMSAGGAIFLTGAVFMFSHIQW